MQNLNTDTKDFWFAARTIANVELKMRNYFQDCKIEHFIPSKKSSVKKNNVMKEVESPVIKNLIFFKTNFGIVNTIFSINHRKIYRIRNAEGLIIIPEKSMNEFISFTNCYSDKVEFIPTDAVVGDKMMIKFGPLAGMQGIVTKINGKNLFTIRLDGLLIAAAHIAKKDLVKVTK